jgi:hypothetical protein
MRFLPMLCAVATTALLATAAPAQQTIPSASPGEEAGGGASAPAAKPKKICRAGDAPDTGSRVASRRICKTREQWEQHNKRNRG